MNLTLRALAGLSVWSIAMAAGANALAQANPPPAPAPYPAPGYQQPASAYPQQPAPGYQQPAPGYAQPAPAPGYALPGPGYPPPAPGYPPPAPGYAQPAPGYWQPAPGYGAPAVPAGPLEWYDTFYSHIGGTLGVHGWGSLTLSQGGRSASGDLSGKFKGGVLIAGYAPVTPTVHLGGYFSYSSGDMELKSVKHQGTTVVEGGRKSFDHLSVGFSLKAGSRLHERVWLGLVGDVGFYVLDTSESDAWYGVEVSPRLHLDVLGVSAGGFKMGPFVSLGPTAVPYMGGKFAHSSVDGSAWLVYITLCLGATFGS